jgi:hypothetical protein
MCPGSGFIDVNAPSRTETRATCTRNGRENHAGSYSFDRQLGTADELVANVASAAVIHSRLARP